MDAVSAQYNSNSQPPVAWRYSGNQMKRWRMKANISREELAAANYSLDTIKSMEQGVRMHVPGLPRRVRGGPGGRGGRRTGRRVHPRHVPGRPQSRVRGRGRRPPAAEVRAAGGLRSKAERAL
ncbi:helix-turn-helix domain-containing protein [Streptomyces coeruleorubidus]|uniref:helix-turn-helix domain-containing protein n=1 Tax=Streptomyces coeruleorubidus TaxID=116188 RepID=UPI003CD0279A